MLTSVAVAAARCYLAMTKERSRMLASDPASDCSEYYAVVDERLSMATDTWQHMPIVQSLGWRTGAVDDWTCPSTDGCPRLVDGVGVHVPS